jgi:predicted RNA-binding Zn ribbon-like protein
MDNEFGKRVGGSPCLDFVNSVRGRIGHGDGTRARDHADRVVGERLLSYDALLRWTLFSGTLTSADTRPLAREASASPAAAAAVLARGLVLREALYRLFTAAIEDRPAERKDLAAFNEELKAARAHERLAATAGSTPAPRFGWEWTDARTALDRMLWPIVRSAAELLTGPDLARVHQCPGPECGWLFLDTSRSHRRQWCNMADCGNLAKVHRFRERQRSQA